MSEPLDKGKFIFKGIQEGDGEGKREIKFNPPLVIDYIIYEKKDKDTGKDNYLDDIKVMGFATFDFGMDIEMALDVEHNHLINSYNGLTENSSITDKFMQTIIYDLMHAFFHIPQDPNYGYHHWALLGWLKDRANIQEYNL